MHEKALMSVKVTIRNYSTILPSPYQYRKAHAAPAAVVGVVCAVLVWSVVAWDRVVVALQLHKHFSRLYLIPSHFVVVVF